MMHSEFSGLSVVVTGAGSGIGLEVCTALSEFGAIVLGLTLKKVTCALLLNGFSATLEIRKA